MSVGVTGKQHELKKQHAGRPNPWTTTEPGQDELADHRLNLKEQEGTEQAQQRKLQIHGSENRNVTTQAMPEPSMLAISFCSKASKPALK